MRTVVIQRRTGAVLGYCDVTFPEGRGRNYYVGVVIRPRVFTSVRFRFKWSDLAPTVCNGSGWSQDWSQDERERSRQFYLIAYGLRDARLLRGFESLEELVPQYTPGCLGASPERTL